MNSIIIVAKRGFELEQLRRAIPATFNVDEAANGRLVVESRGRRAYLGGDVRIAAEMEPEEALRLLRMMPDPVFYTLDFSDISLCRELLIAIADRGDIIVDNDHGVVLPGSEFVRVLRSQVDWDWRKGASSRHFVP